MVNHTPASARFRGSAHRARSLVQIRAADVSRVTKGNFRFNLTVAAHLGERPQSAQDLPLLERSTYAKDCPIPAVRNTLPIGSVEWRPDTCHLRRRHASDADQWPPGTC